jgi:hypothetical protein
LARGKGRCGVPRITNNVVGVADEGVISVERHTGERFARAVVVVIIIIIGVVVFFFF